MAARGATAPRTSGTRRLGLFLALWPLLAGGACAGVRPRPALAQIPAPWPRPEPAAQAEHTPAPRGAGLALRPGDGLRLYFPRDAELNGEYAVDETGAVVLPLLGRRQVADVPCDVLKARLIRELESQLANQAVQVVPFIRVRILGAVNRPGLYAVDGTMTLGDAVALAGGATTSGRLEDVRVIGIGGGMAAHGDNTALLWGRVLSGDQIVVPERSWLARNGAAVAGGTLSALAIVLSRLVF